MRTSIGFLALAGFLVAPLAAASAQEVAFKSYPEGQEFGRKAGKPLAVIVGAGRTGLNHLTQEGTVSPEVRKTLADKYVCVFLDTNRPADRAVIRQLGIQSGTGLVLSDRTGDLQAFSHDGTLPASDLSRQLKRFADPHVIVSATQSNASQRYSFYPQTELAGEYTGAPAYPAAPAIQPALGGFQPSFGGFQPALGGFQPSFGGSISGGRSGGC
jgi:hypothetical protein